MGSRNADRISIVQLRPAGETAADMQRRRWRVRAVCLSCRTTIAVDLARVIRERGPDVSLWDREQPCRRRGCGGKVWFEAQAPGMPGFDVLIGAPQPREPAWKRGRA